MIKYYLIFFDINIDEFNNKMSLENILNLINKNKKNYPFNINSKNEIILDIINNISYEIKKKIDISIDNFRDISILSSTCWNKKNYLFYKEIIQLFLDYINFQNSLYIKSHNKKDLLDSYLINIKKNSIFILSLFIKQLKDIQDKNRLYIKSYTTYIYKFSSLYINDLVINSENILNSYKFNKTILENLKFNKTIITSENKENEEDKENKENDKLTDLDYDDNMDYNNSDEDYNNSDKDYNNSDEDYNSNKDYNNSNEYDYE